MNPTTFALHGPDAAQLQPGTWLLEASAGTGKTYTIVGILLRMIIEDGKRLDRCIVMTFTRAATAELRERIRKGLHQALHLIEGAAESSDPFMQSLWLNWGQDADKRQQARQRLLTALADLDASLIATIHGVCKRLLDDHALHTGIGIGAELDGDLSSWRQACIHDLLRQWTRALSPAAAKLVGDSLNPDKLSSDCQQIENHPDVVFTGLVPAMGPAQVAYCLEEVERNWPQWAAAITQFYTERQAILGSVAEYHPRRISEQLLVIKKLLTEGSDCDRLELACQRFLNPNHRKARLGRDHVKQLFKQEWYKGLRRLLACPHGVRRQVLEDYRQALRDRPLSGGHLHYSDLLSALDQALRSADGPELQQSVQERYDVVLVDEFQDTDPVQWRILQGLFASSGKHLFLIGDPKQSIYAFRGADVHAYLQVAQQPALKRASLDTNHRSDVALVAAVNHLFDRGPESFVEEGIHFSPVKAVHSSRLDTGNCDDRPMQIWWQESRNARDMRREIANNIAAEIVTLLDQAQLTDPTQRPLRASDIAVLVSSHREGDIIAEALARLPQAIACVRNIRASVFASQTAFELNSVLTAVLAPHRERAVRTAALTRLCGLQSQDLLDEQGGTAIEELVAGLRELRLRWHGQGFTAAWQDFLDQGCGTTSPRILLAGSHDGERSLTDFLHLGDLLAQTEQEQGLGPDALLDWYQNCLADPSKAHEDQLLRLDRDDDAVHILTVHTAKGLQYPVVFAPFLWSGRRIDADRLFHHDHQAQWWIGPRKRRDHVEAAQIRDSLAEHLRLAYVALTRAMHRCYLVHAAQAKYGPYPGSTLSALSWLAVAAGRLEPDQVVDVLADELKEADWFARHASVWEHEAIHVVEHLDTSSRGNAVPLRLEPETVSTLDKPLADWQERQRHRWFSSYSGLVRNRPVDEPDYDQVRSEHTPDDSLPRGARFGTALHAVFEFTDFAADDATIETSCARYMHEQGFGDSYNGALTALVKQVLDHPVPGIGSSLRHCARQRSAEMDVLLPVARSSDLAEVFRAHAHPSWRSYADDIPDLYLPGGYFTGIIDLVFVHAGCFHLLDWKSNDLFRRGGYHTEAMRAEMRHHHYVLQFHLYTVALHRLLRMRLPDYDYDTHIGSAHYVFVRGVGNDAADPQAGWYTDRPPRAMIEALDACFAEVAHA